MLIDNDKLNTAQARSGKSMRELGISKGTLQNIRKEKNVRPQTVHKIAVALGCDVTEIIVEVS